MITKVLTIIGIGLLIGTSIARAETVPLDTEALATLAVQDHGRKKPFTTFAHEMLLELSGSEVIHRLRQQSSETRVLVYSGTQSVAAIRRCLLAEPDGFVEKFDDIDILREGLKAVVAGRKYFTSLPAGLLNKLRYEKLDLTEREIEILQLIAEGQFSKEIAARLNISFKTVETHRANLMHKINARNMADITRYAMRAGLIE